MKLDSVTYAVRQFTWKKKFGVAEASDLGVPPGQIPGHCMYDDSADYGFYVQGDTKKIDFYFSDELHRGVGSDREAYGFEYRSECGKFIIHILND